MVRVTGLLVYLNGGHPPGHMVRPRSGPDPSIRYDHMVRPRPGPDPSVRYDHMVRPRPRPDQGDRYDLILWPPTGTVFNGNAVVS